jgi:hypothetical protein
VLGENPFQSHYVHRGTEVLGENLFQSHYSTTNTTSPHLGSNPGCSSGK